MEPKTTGVPTGFPQLDELTGGLRAGDLIIVAGRPAVGTTVFAMNVAVHVAKEEAVPVLVLSLEAPGGYFDRYLLTFLGRVDASRTRRQLRLERDEWTRLADAAEIVRAIPLHVENARCIAFSLLVDICHEWNRDTPRGLIVVDSLQLLPPVDDPTFPVTPQRRKKQLTEIAGVLKALAMKLSMPVLVTAQLDHRVERRASKRPVLSDLKPAGAVAEIADTVMFLYRDEMYNPETQDTGIAEVIVAKEPRGRTGTARLRFVGRELRFENLTVPTSPPTP